MKRVLVILRGEPFQQSIKQLPGYRSKDTGTVFTLKDVFRDV
jgi:hypothetical protein